MNRKLPLFQIFEIFFESRLPKLSKQVINTSIFFIYLTFSLNTSSVEARSSIFFSETNEKQT